MSDTSWRDRLQSARVSAPEFPIFDTDASPADPMALFEEWLGLALGGTVSQPQAMVVATVQLPGGDREPAPSARTLLLKDVTSEGLWFATLSTSPKGRELAANPNVALLLYWREQGRQIRVTGTVETGSRDLARTDFLSRRSMARAIVIGGQQSEPLPATDAEYENAVKRASDQIDADPDFVPDDWQAYVVRAVEYEFWQAARQRDQLRLRYRLTESTWQREMLWP